MQEVVPIAAGLVIGLLVQRLRPAWLRSVVLIALCVVFGVFASYISGELAVSEMFITFDMMLVWLGALLSIGAISLWRRRSAQLR